uniref:Uncharacterized protein n=1 Tax=Candidatus Kentrum eta TaxID=2126337 RepID=A0A450VCH8_9GAMM|nr:MAG: hypothetical protein BECKH772A_GA0070896_100953 [Candidatus Kentron sp. H]VFJ96589.1 MAG: hypothetical protein BECKH772B_GA0070898_100944 [Candidatus Kentron sp. H]VFK02512.1 MAG: hypothetical protein BECKH772C_GA0070978_100933 [Candidatus Kentron sp. H]
MGRFQRNIGVPQGQIRCPFRNIPCLGRGKHLMECAVPARRTLSKMAFISLGYPGGEVSPHGFRATVRVLPDGVLGFRVTKRRQSARIGAAPRLSLAAKTKLVNNGWPSRGVEVNSG